MKNNLEIIPALEYQWNTGWANSIAHSDINSVIDELKSIEEVYGEINPERIIESSKNKKSVLHNYFQWDDVKAANNWRLWQARTLLSKIEVKIISDGEPKFVRVYETIRRNTFDIPHYKKYDILSSEDELNIKKIIISDLRRIRTKTTKYANMYKVLEYIDKAIEELQKESTETKEEIKPVLSAVN